jgi:hypothetical protein
MDRTWLVWFGVGVLVALLSGVLALTWQAQTLRELTARDRVRAAEVAGLRAQVKSLGGNPDTPVVNVTVRPGGPAPAASPTTRSDRAPQPGTAPSPRSSASSRPPVKTPSPSPSPTCLVHVIGCLP